MTRPTVSVRNPARDAREYYLFRRRGGFVFYVPETVVFTPTDERFFIPVAHPRASFFSPIYASYTTPLTNDAADIQTPNVLRDSLCARSCSRKTVHVSGCAGWGWRGREIAWSANSETKSRRRRIRCGLRPNIKTAESD